jgi:IS5 family transposase
MESFLRAVKEYNTAVREHEKCVKGCEYDSGYFCARERQEVNECEKKLWVAFKEAVAAAITELQTER